jgi:hypothetical protein
MHQARHVRRGASGAAPQARHVRRGASGAAHQARRLRRGVSCAVYPVQCILCNTCMCVIHRSHRNKQMDERLLYYYRRTKARKDPNCLCFIFDKWNSYTTTVPFFTRSPLTNFASNYRHFILRLHVLLVLVHGKPDSNYFFVLNDSVSADANFNIEGIRRSLLLHQDGKPLPPLIYSYSDSGEKCIVLLIYFGTLVEREVCHVALSIFVQPANALLL